MLSWRLVTLPLKAISLIIAVYIIWVLVIYRDISVENLEHKYGGNNLLKVNVDGVNIRYKIEGSGPTLVLIHSHFYTMRQWQQWVDILKKNFTVIRYDLTSHGLTGPDPTNDYSRQRSSFLLQGLLDHLHVNKATIIGSSTGGGIAYTYATEHPENIENLVLINTPGMPKTSNKYMDKKLPSWGGFLFYLLPEPLFDAFLKAPIIDDSIVTSELLTEFHEMYRRDGNRMAEYERLRGYEKMDVTPLLNKITVPTLILWGEKNPQLPVEHVELFAESLINSKRVETIIYPNIGHVIPLENPEQSANDTASFILKNTINTHSKEHIN